MRKRNFGYPSRAVLRPRLIARFPPTAIPAPRPLLMALSSQGVRLAWPEAPYRPSRALPLLIPPIPPLGRLFRGVLQAPPNRGNRGGTSTAAVCDAPPNDRCGPRFSVKHQRAVQCGLAAPTPRPMMTTTTRATLCCSCSPTSLRLYLRTSLRWTSSWWHYPVVSPWTF